jgi:hypothetical protein
MTTATLSNSQSLEGVNNLQPTWVGWWLGWQASRHDPLSVTQPYAWQHFTQRHESTCYKLTWVGWWCERYCLSLPQVLVKQRSSVHGGSLTRTLTSSLTDSSLLLLLGCKGLQQLPQLLPCGPVALLQFAA